MAPSTGPTSGAIDATGGPWYVKLIAWRRRRRDDRRHAGGLTRSATGSVTSAAADADAADGGSVAGDERGALVRLDVEDARPVADEHAELELVDAEARAAHVDLRAARRRPARGQDAAQRDGDELVAHRRRLAAQRRRRRLAIAAAVREQHVGDALARRLAGPHSSRLAATVSASHGTLSGFCARRRGFAGGRRDALERHARA